MKALKTPDNFLLAEAYDIRFGKLDPYDTDSKTGEPIEKWGMYNKDGEPILYAIDNNYTVVEFDPADKPEDYVEGKYFFINGQFVLNPDWVPPLPPIEDQVAELAIDIATVDENTAQVAADLDFIAMELGINLDE